MNIDFVKIDITSIRMNLINLKQLVFEVTDTCNLNCKYSGYGEFYEGYDYNTKTNQFDPKYVSSFSDKKHGSWTYEWPNHYWSWIFGDKYKGTKVIVNKKTLKSDFFKLKNDFYGGIEMNKFYMSNNGMFISSISALELIAAFEKALKNNNLSSKEKDKIESLKKSLNENDNEVLFVGEMF